MLSCEYCEIFKNIYFEEHLQTAASKELLVKHNLFFCIFLEVFVTENFNTKAAQLLKNYGLDVLKYAICCSEGSV